ncbi:ataxin-7-like protein 2 [Camarhynchus parvulus]|uniref:ataxin-7-like protein 2 n=1 Tax=Geospiza parvula TaxID=87175 RepID=UPI001237D8E0|nr:ataxin-7-like protein 2 [Camarhynchus parvulus]
MTLIKEDMDIFGHCPAHDEFYLVVCNHCSQVVKPQAFQKHCERRHGPLSKLYARATALFVPVVNLEKIPSIPKPDGHGIKVPPKAVPTNSKESLGKPAAAAVPKEPPVPAGVGGDSAMPESVPAPGDKDVGAPKAPPRSHRKLARKECDLNRQCGVRNPDTNKLCTRLLTCKIHSVHQRREVQGRAKDFDVLVAELKASTRRGDPPKDRSPPEKEPLHPALQDTPSLLQPPSTPPCRARLPHCLHPPRARLSSASDPEDVPATSGEGGTGGLPLPLPKGGSRVSSEESEEEGAEEPPRTPLRPPRPQAFCTFGSRLVTPGCYVFDRRLDRFCAALGSMLEQHLSAHRWRKIPPAVVPPLHLPAAPPSPAAPLYGPAAPSPPLRSLSGAGGCRLPTSLTYTVGSPPAAAACSQPECGGGGSQSITSPLPANTPSPSFSKLPPGKASRSPRARDAEPRPWQPPPRAGSPPYKRTCLGDSVKGKNQALAPPGKTKLTPPASPSIPILNGTPRVRRPPPSQPCRPPPAARDPPNAAAAPGEDEVKKRKNAATYCRALKGKAAPGLPGPPGPPGSGSSGAGGSVRRKKPGTPLGFEEKRSALKSKAH